MGHIRIITGWREPLVVCALKSKKCVLLWQIYQQPRVQISSLHLGREMLGWWCWCDVRRAHMFMVKQCRVLRRSTSLPMPLGRLALKNSFSGALLGKPLALWWVAVCTSLPEPSRSSGFMNTFHSCLLCLVGCNDIFGHHLHFCVSWLAALFVPRTLSSWCTKVVSG